jgi:hypothetical protein
VVVLAEIGQGPAVPASLIGPPADLDRPRRPTQDAPSAFGQPPWRVFGIGVSTVRRSYQGSGATHRSRLITTTSSAVSAMEASGKSRA